MSTGFKRSAMPTEAQLALGRIFRLMSRPSQSGDVEQYDACRALILEASECIAITDDAPNYVRDRMKGAQEDVR